MSLPFESSAKVEGDLAVMVDVAYPRAAVRRTASRSSATQASPHGDDAPGAPNSELSSSIHTPSAGPARGAGLEITNDRPEQARGEKPRAERT